MATAITIHDLPDDMLHEIFGHVLTGELEDDSSLCYATRSPKGAHLALRCVCRRWRDIADWVRLSTSQICVETSELADAGAVQARHPAAVKNLVLAGWMGAHSTIVSRAATSLFNGSVDLRRALVALTLDTCCLPSLLPVVTPLASCTALTQLELIWTSHEKERAVPSNMLAPLSALRMLKELGYGRYLGEEARTSARLAPLPALPDAPRLTCFAVRSTGNFVPVGIDAALGRLRRLEFYRLAPEQGLLHAEDPFLLRAAFDAGTWQSSRLTGLQELAVRFGSVHDWGAPLRPPPAVSRAGSEWAPLAGQVTKLTVKVESIGYRRPSTGIVAGLGVLTGLRFLHVSADLGGPAELTDSVLLKPVSVGHLHAPGLTELLCLCTTTPVSVARFPNLVHLYLQSVTRQPPLNLRSLVARSSLKVLSLAGCLTAPSLINLAELFVGGAGWPVLEELWLEEVVLEWDASGSASAPIAAEFAVRARQLLPALVVVGIREPVGRGALPDRSRVGFVVACRRHVVPALAGLHAGGG